MQQLLLELVAVKSLLGIPLC